MHEISLLENILEIIEQQAELQGFKQVKRVTLEIGMLSCVEAEAMHFGFDAVMKNTLAEKAILELSYQQGLGRCRFCDHQVAMQTLYDPCSACGKPGLEVVQGNDLKLIDLIVI